MPLFSSERLDFTSWTLADAQDAYRLWGDPAVMQMVDTRDNFSRAQTMRRLEAEIRCAEEHGVQYWKCLAKGTAKLVGCCGLRPWVYSKTPQPTYELGFHLLHSEWGKGYASEAARRVIQKAFLELGQENLLAGHHPDNAPSRRVLLKLGFVPIDPVYYPPTDKYHPAYELKRDPAATKMGTLDPSLPKT